MAQTGRTSHQGILAIDRATTINRYSGGAVIAPWEVDQLDDTWLDLFEGMARDLPEMQAHVKAVNAKRAEFMRQHPTYRKVH